MSIWDSGRLLGYIEDLGFVPEKEFSDREFVKVFGRAILASNRRVVLDPPESGNITVEQVILALQEMDQKKKR